MITNVRNLLNLDALRILSQAIIWSLTAFEALKHPKHNCLEIKTDSLINENSQSYQSNTVIKQNSTQDYHSDYDKTGFLFYTTKKIPYTKDNCENISIIRNNYCSNPRLTMSNDCSVTYH